jgi:DNA polymerase-3 subunit epsilon
MRQIVLDTETTGLDTADGHRIIEIGCVELVNRRLTGRHYHQYLNPQREVDAGAYEVHGLGNDFLADKPVFAHIADDFLQFITGAELIIHNAPFDIGFLDYELELLAQVSGSNSRSISDLCGVIDTLQMARSLHPGQRNTLDALCVRYGVDNSSRDLHGALLDSEILADVYLTMTGGQTDLSLQTDSGRGAEFSEWVQGEIYRVSREGLSLTVQKASDQELAEHEAYLAMLDKKSDGTLWRRQS